MSKVFIADWRYLLLVSGLLFGFSLVLGRVAYLHVWKAEELAGIAEQNRKSIQVLAARRGNILDSRGNILAATRPLIEVGIDPKVFREEDAKKLPELARLLNVPEETLREKARRRTRRGTAHPQDIRLVRWVKIADAIDDATYRAVRDLGIRGVYGNRYYERNYPAGDLAAHVVGYIGYIDDPSEAEPVLRPLLGVERFMDFYLRGQDGWREMERDGRRRELAQYRRELRPTDGLNVELTLDMVVQSIVETEIERLVAEYSPQGISVIVSDPHDGRVRALANYPSFDPNRFHRSEVSHLRNRAVGDIFEPGSTFKIVPAAAALNEGIVALDDQFDCSVDAVEYRGRTIRMPRDVTPNGRLDFREVVIKSSNRGAALLGMRLGESRLHDYSRAFGFGSRTGWGPGAESPGILPPVREWDGLTISRMPMGHAISATPLQLHQAMGVVSNGGVLMEPLIVNRVLDHESSPLLEFAPRAIRRVLRDDTAAVMTEILNAAASPGGTASLAYIPGYEVAGKTGTTQKIVDGRYSNDYHIASFSGFFPASKPRLAITVVVDEPEIPGTAYGGRVAAPAFRNIAEQLIQYFSIPPTASREETPIALWESNR